MKACYWLLAGLFFTATAGTAAAQDSKSDDDSSSGRVVAALSACRAIPVAETRLACFDKASAQLDAAIASKEVRVVDRTDIRKARRSLFGFSLPRLRLFGGDDEKANGEEAFTEINTKVASARAAGNGRVEIRLADDTGAVWQTTDPMSFPPKPGADIRIRSGAMGNYFIAVEGRSYRGMRVR